MLIYCHCVISPFFVGGSLEGEFEISLGEQSERICSKFNVKINQFWEIELTDISWAIVFRNLLENHLWIEVISQRFDKYTHSEKLSATIILPTWDLEHVILNLLVDVFILTFMVQCNFVEKGSCGTELLIMIVGQELHLTLLLQLQTHDNIFT